LTDGEDSRFVNTVSVDGTKDYMRPLAAAKFPEATSDDREYNIKRISA
jgi:hypothetical protein